MAVDLGVYGALVGQFLEALREDEFYSERILTSAKKADQRRKERLSASGSIKDSRGEKSSSRRED